jgi:hypothetical protein
MLATNISTSFEMKKQTVANFLDISGSYDNVLIDVLCGVMQEKELLLEFSYLCGACCGVKHSFSVLRVLNV